MSFEKSAFAAHGPGHNQFFFLSGRLRLFADNLKVAALIKPQRPFILRKNVQTEMPAAAFDVSEELKADSVVLIFGRDKQRADMIVVDNADEPFDLVLVFKNKSPSDKHRNNYYTAF